MSRLLRRSAALALALLLSAWVEQQDAVVVPHNTLPTRMHVGATDCGPAAARAGRQRDHSRSGQGTAKHSSIKQPFVNG